MSGVERMRESIVGGLRSEKLVTKEKMREESGLFTNVSWARGRVTEAPNPPKKPNSSLGLPII